ncbi:RING finger protein 207-like isoform X1 [Macrobrachium nipponense]|uniref:RING finger protein 207-like isoform X1 n=1 Tax=Macrobrachium nipponense TaxID=159736 RepID=UPI0030C7C698
MDDALEQWSRNPLLCWLCEELYEEPCLLACYHTFCSRCLRQIVHDSKIACPLCGKVTGLKDGQFPPRDNLMVFLVESSCEERPQCANCDKSNQSAMFFCNTCGQALCGHCREETHRARMFSLHDIIHMSKRGREANRKCAVHGEPQIMFSTTKRTMLCINCFRESSLDARLYCVDLDTAYSQGCKKLDRAVMLPGETLIPIDIAYAQARQKLDRAAVSIRDLQGTVREGVFLFKELLDELRKNMEAEKHNINSLSDNLQETVRRTQEGLLREVDGQYEAKDKLFRSQLSSLGSLLPIIQVHLLMCTTFSSSASKYEFLDLVFQLMERLANIAHLSHPLRPGQSSQVRSNFKSEFARSLEPFLSVVGKGRDPLAMPSGSSGCSEKQSSEGGCASRPPSAASVMPPGSSGMPGSRRSLSAAKLKIIESGGPFAEHCKSHENRFRQEMSSKFTRLKEEAQELHRDVTLRRCLTRRGRVEEIVRECASLEEEFKNYSDELEELRVVFDGAWDDQIQRVYAEQEVFQSQVNDVASLRDENKRLMIIAQQLEPYIRSITALMERISPKLQVPQAQAMTSSQVSVVDSSENIMQQILDQISSTCKTDQQQRAEGRGCADGASRGSGGVDDSGVVVSSGSGALIGGIPKPPDPPHTRRTPDHDEDQESDHAHGFSPGPGSGRADPAHPTREGDKYRGPVSPASSMASTLASSVIGGSYMEVRKPDRAVRRKRQNSEGDSLVWERHRGCESESEMVSSTSSLRINQRRGSEGSDVEEVKKGVFMQLLEKVRLRDDKKKHEYESDADEGRASSRERIPVGRVVHRIPRGKVLSDHQTDHYLDLAAAVFDASAVPERPKSACDNTLLRAAEKLYSGLGSVRALSGEPETTGRISAERLDELRLAQARAVAEAVSRSRESSLGRARSAEREEGIRTPKAVPVPKVPQGIQGRSGEFSLGEVKAIVHAEQLGGPSRKSPGRKDMETIYAVATVPRKTSSKKENIYENVPISSEQFGQLFRDDSRHSRPVFKKQNSLDALPSEARKGSGILRKGDSSGLAEGSVRHGTLRKADSFEGHEEAVKTLVAAVQETRILRRKKTK